MEHFIRIAFWIVTLSGCLQAKSLPIKESNIELMKKDVKCPADSKFYTPTNVKVNCITAALDCFMTELRGTVKDECDDPYEYIIPAVDFLEHWMEKRSGHVNDNALKNSIECACENWSQAPFTEFLKEMNSLLQYDNTEASN